MNKHTDFSKITRDEKSNLTYLNNRAMKKFKISKREAKVQIASAFKMTYEF